MENLSFILYIIPIIILGYVADKRNNKFLLYISIILTSILVGFRGENVGIDTASYYNSIINGFPYSWLFPEVGFRKISNILFSIFKNGHIVLFIFSLITIFFIFYRFWDFRKKSSFTFMIFLFITIYIFSPMNILRQFITIAIIFFSTKLLERKKYIIFITIVLLMTLIHKTAILGMIMVIPYLWKSLSSKKKLVLIIPIIAASIVGIKYSLNIGGHHINNYLDSSKAINGFNIPFLYRIIIFSISYLIYKKNIIIVINENKQKKIKNSKDDNFNIITTIYFIGLCFNSFGLFFDKMSRLSYFFMIFECVYWGYMFKSSNNKGVNFWMIIIFAGYAFMTELLINGNGIFPYYIEFF